MIKRLLSILIGAALALELQRWWDSRRARYTPNALAGSFLDMVNARLEAKRPGATR